MAASVGTPLVVLTLLEIARVPDPPRSGILAIAVFLAFFSLFVWVPVVLVTAASRSFPEPVGPGDYVLVTSLSGADWTFAGRQRLPAAALVLVTHQGVDVVFRATKASLRFKEEPLVESRRVRIRFTEVRAVRVVSEGGFVEYVYYSNGKPLDANSHMAQVQRLRSVLDWGAPDA